MKLTQLERFNLKINKTESCWDWLAGKNLGGYGRFYFNGKLGMAHRYSYEEYKGEIPHGLHIDHLCRNRACVNPEHLEAVTPRENILRGIAPAAINHRRTECKSGHPYSGENLRKKGDFRICRICSRFWQSKYKSKNKDRINKINLDRYYTKKALSQQTPALKREKVSVFQIDFKYTTSLLKP